MNSLGGLPNLTEVLTPTFIGALLAVGIVIVIFFSIAAYKSVNEPVHVVTPCSINGHHYRAPLTGWRCTNCGDDVLHEGDPIGLATSQSASTPPASIIERWLMGGRGR